MTKHKYYTKILHKIELLKEKAEQKKLTKVQEKTLKELNRDRIIFENNHLYV